MLFVPFTVPTFPATHHQTTHPAHQTHHQQLQATTQNPVQQPQQLTQLNQLSHLNHQGIVPATTNQPTIHSTSCSPQQQATTPNKIRSINIRNEASCGCAADGRGHLLYDGRSEPSKGETHQREEYCEKVEVTLMP
ncbi:uncharacterized protein LOC122538403, partial [Frieseomelitta varia]|uniref:uncharacterized protein LOC122538403 n=1 Tax=Frieseomelitta varia TaxID=561572 RepID=UPI001CB6AB1F